MIGNVFQNLSVGIWLRKDGSCAIGVGLTVSLENRMRGRVLDRRQREEHCPIGGGRGFFSPSHHTTRHAGPHRAVPRACRAEAGHSVTTPAAL
jgi:hypothetical protein